MITPITKKLLATLLLCFIAASPVVSAADSPSTSHESTSPAPTATSSPPAAALQGSIKKLDIEAAESLRQMGDCLKKVERTTLELMGEATRQAYIAVGDPDVVGTMIIPAIPSPSAMAAVGPYLKIRKKWYDYYLDQIASLFPIYAEYTDALVMPDSVKDKATVLLEQMRAPFADAKDHYMVLLKMKKDLPNKIDNRKVAVFSVIIHDDMDKMDKIRRDVFALLKESEQK